MKPLSKIGWMCIGIALVLKLIVFAHYNGFVDPVGAISHMLAAIVWGGLSLAGLFIFIMALLFLSA